VDFRADVLGLDGVSPHRTDRLDFGFGFAETGHAVAGFPLPAFFENFNALEALEDVAFSTSRAGRAETAML